MINSDADTYSGSNYGNGGEVFTLDEPHHGQPVSLALNLPPLGVLILRRSKGAPHGHRGLTTMA